MKHLTLIICFSVVFLLLNGCKSTVVNWEDNSTPGRREYVWTIIDSIGSNTSLSKMWGDSPENIWIGGGFAINPAERLWHYDGNKLKAVCVEGLYPYCVFGFGNNNIMSSSNRDVWRYNGSTWSKWFTLNMFDLDSYFLASLYDLNGNNANNLWAVGSVWDNTGIIEDGLIYKDTGEGLLKIYKTDFKNTTFIKVFPGYTDNECFIFGVKRGHNPWIDSSAVYQYDGNKLHQICIGVMEDSNEGCALNKINGIIYITIGHKIYRYFDGRLYEYLTINHPEFVMAVSGRNEKDLFLWAIGGLLHYNGTDVQYVYNPGWPIFVHERILFFNKEVFVFAQNTITGKYYFIKGVLPDKN